MREYYVNGRGHGKVAYQQWFLDEWSKVVNTECGARRSFDGQPHVCTLQVLHGGNHFDYSTRFAWPKGDCPASKNSLLCTLDAGHEGHHEAGGTQGAIHAVWPQFHETPEVVLELTLEELKGLVYALSGPEWKEDEPELVAKIDKALKEAL